MKRILIALSISVLIYSCGNQDPPEPVKPDTGWVVYFDKSFDQNNPKLIEAGDVYHFEWSTLDSIALEKPDNVDGWLKNGRFSPTSIGDTYTIRIDYEVKSTIPSNNFGELVIDIGGDQGEIQTRPFSMPNDLWIPESKTILVWTLGTFKSNGALLGIRAKRQDLYLGNYSISISRDHDAS